MNSLRSLLNELAAKAASLEPAETWVRFDGEELSVAPDAETKARIRHVRTEEGARKYGQPIGSVITSDIVPHAALDFVPGKVSRWVPSDGSNYELVDESKRFEGAIVRMPNTRNWNLIARDTKTGRHINEKYTNFTLATRVFDRWRDSILGPENTRRVKPKSDKRFVDQEKWGVYGRDWSFGDEPKRGFPTWDEGDFEGRKKLATYLTKRLGFEVDTTSPYADKGGLNIRPNYHEVMNEYLGHMVDQYPGFETLLTKIGSSSSMSNALAFNSVVLSENERGLPDFSADRTTAIYMNPHYFGSTPTKLVTSLKSAGQEGSRHWSTRYSDLEERYPDYTSQQITSLVTSVHEVGHTVARVVAFDELRGTTTKNNLSEDERDYYKSLFWQKAAPVMANHGFGDEEDIYDAMLHPQSDKSSIVLNSAKMQTALSAYGATNLHEMLAEVWAEYELDSEPRSFAAEIGLAMQDTLEEWLYWNAEDEE